jgi:uncharacterized protein (DUF1800 family)
LQQKRRDEAFDLKGWWYQELLTTPSPLTERMTLFWHNHFTSSFHKVKWPALLYRQNVLLRYHAVGSFRESLFQVAKDPYVTAKLWREFVSDQPDPTEVERLATSFRNSGY